MKIQQNISLNSTFHNKPIVTDVFYKENKTRKPLVIFCHGFKGFKDWGAWNLVAAQFAENQLFFVKFNFSHNGGTLQNPIDFPDLEAFANNNFMLELNDLQDVINYFVNTEEYKNEIDIDKIILIGHSRGGGIVTLKASENNKITKVISWAGVSDFGIHFANKEGLSLWEKYGVTFIENSRTHQKMPLNYQFYKNFEENNERLNIKNAVKKLTIPQLIIQGSLDEVVLPIEAENLHSCNPMSRLEIIEGMNHALDCTQPYLKETLPVNLQKVIDVCLNFIIN